jgi:septum site-determining protein MinC
LTSANAVRSRQSIRFRGRSFVAFVLAPTPPIADWLDELDRWSKTSPDFFNGRPTILDLGGQPLPTPEISRLVAVLAERGIRIVGLDGVEAHQLDPSMPPLLKGGRPAAEAAADEPCSTQAPVEVSAAAAPPRNEPNSLLVESPIRSGQAVVFPYGDLTVLGAVSSGAEVVAGGSIHIYGALRGRAMAGAMGNNTKARIFCSRNEAELIAIDGYYRTAEDMAPELRGRPVQCWLDDRMLQITALD